MRSIVGRFGLWRLWRNPLGRRLYRLLQRLGLVVAAMVRYETTPATAAERPAVPTAFELDSWRADDRSLPADVPSGLEPTDVVVGATLEDDLVGYCVLSPRSVLVEEIGGVVEPTGVCLWDLYVKPGYRGRGLGTALLWRARVDDLVAETGRIEAFVAVDNRPSRRAFRSAGFVPAERLLAVGWRERTYRRRRSLTGPSGPQ